MTCRPANLARVRANLREIRRTLVEHPETRERTAALFDADPTLGTLTELENPCPTTLDEAHTPSASRSEKSSEQSVSSNPSAPTLT